MKKIIKIISIIIVIIVIIILIVFNFSTEIVENVENETIIQPEEEISEEQMRRTIITLYFEDKISTQLTKEFVSIDAKELVDNPYKYIVNLLLKGPNEEGLQNSIPDGTIVNTAELIEDCVYLDLSEEFLNASGTNAIYSIVNSLTELKEVNSVKFFINGEEKENLKEAFVRK